MKNVARGLGDSAAPANLTQASEMIVGPSLNSAHIIRLACLVVRSSAIFLAGGA